jgi:hypothetical protein
MHLRLYIVDLGEVRPRVWTAATKGHTFHLTDDEYGERRWNDIDRGKPKNSEKNLSQCHFIRHKSYMDW